MKHCKELTLLAALELDNTHYIAVLKFTCVCIVLTKKMFWLGTNMIDLFDKFGYH